MQLRHEYKHIITLADYITLRSRLNAVMKLDPHAGPDGCYHIRSLYFDTPTDRMLREKLDGVSRREKYRIRCYNGFEGFIRLEKKIKIGGLGTKVSAVLSRSETQRILDGDIGFLQDRPEEVLHQLYTAMRCDLLRPKTLVDYTRRPYVCAQGNVRVTLDDHIRTGLYVNDLFDTSSPTMQASDVAILEIKYDNYLPEHIRQVVQLGSASENAFSKYAACRQFEGLF